MLERFASMLRNELHAERVLLFGSRARGQSRPDSDYDVMVVSDQFIGKSRRERPVELYRRWYASGADAPIDRICLTRDEFDDALLRISLVAAVLPEAIDLLPVAAPSP